MATYRSAAEWSAKTYRVAQTLPRINALRVQRASQVIVDVYNGEVAAKAPGGRLRGTARSGRQPSRVRATFPTVKVPANGHVTSLVGARGPAQLLEYDINPHYILATGLGTRGTVRRLQNRLDAAYAFRGGLQRGTFRASKRDFTSPFNKKNSVNARATKKALTVGATGGIGPATLRAWAFSPGVQRSDGPWSRSQKKSRPMALKAMQGVWSDALKVR